MSDAPKKPSVAWPVFMSLVSLASHFDKRYIIVTQEKLLELVAQTTGRVMSRRTLNRHLLGLERGGYIARTQRHRTRPRSRELELRATLYTFGQFGTVWIKQMRQAAQIPLGRRAVPKTAQSKRLSLSEKRHGVDKSPTPRRSETNRGPRKRGHVTAPRRWR